MQPVFLIGYMGSGKTTLGLAAGKAAGITFIDLDQYIEAQSGCSVSELFARSGEAGFRDIERRMLHELASRENVIVACGGGTPCFFDNMEYMNSHGITVWLDASLWRLSERLKLGRRQRPLIASLDDEQLDAYIEQALDERRAFYERARLRFCADRLDDAAQIAQSVREFLAMLNLNTQCHNHG